MVQNLVVLDYAHRHSLLPTSGEVLESAIEHGSCDALAFLVDHGYEMTTDTTSLAAREGNLACLVFLHENVFNILEPARAVHSHLFCL